MGVDVADAEAEQRVAINEGEDFCVAGENGLGQVGERGQDDLSYAQMTEGKFADNEGMRQNHPGVEQRGERRIARAQMIDRDRLSTRITPGAAGASWAP